VQSSKSSIQQSCHIAPFTQDQNTIKTKKFVKMATVMLKVMSINKLVSV